VFERAGSEEVNKKLLSVQKGTAVGEPDGIKVRFFLEQISAAEYKGEPVFVALLPKEHYRMQRRQMFRVNTQIRNPVNVTLSLPDGQEITLAVGNISSGGLRLDDVDHLLDCEVTQMLPGCRINFPDVEPFLIDLKVCNSYEVKKRKGVSVHYVGCEFVNIRASDESEIQNYINRLQLAQRAMTR
jgi:c-di-GMP-binding flagellar brake protein YcgR